MHNKRWKQDYNKEYYERNKDYWVKRYQAMKGAVNDDADFQKRTVGKVASGDWTVGEGVALIRRNAEGSQAYDRAELESARINAKRAMQEYKWAERTYGKTPVTELWKAGASGIADAGKKFIQKFKDIPGLRKKSKS